LGETRKIDRDPMTPIRIVKGLDVPIAGVPDPTIGDGAPVSSVALLGGDHVGLRPLMRIDDGAEIALGEPLFVDRRHPEIVFAAPGGGIVRSINRGARRSLTSVVVDLAESEPRRAAFDPWPSGALAALRRDQVVDALLTSGLWPALRTRPFDRIPPPDAAPSSIFVTAMDTNPLAAPAETIIEAARPEFADGLTVVSRLVEGSVFVCHSPTLDPPLGEGANVRAVRFSGPHPAGAVGTHIHFLDSVGAAKTVWHLGYQDVIAIGRTFATGTLSVERVVALAGPVVERPRLIRTRLGADIGALTQGELAAGDHRVISGSVLSGRRALGPEAYLGRYHTQISALAEAGDGRGRKKGFTIYRLSSPGRPRRERHALTTARHGAPTAMLPLGGYERVMPLDILPTQLLRALVIGDDEQARALGCLELDEEDLALVEFVCPSKGAYGALLRACLDRIAKAG
jgi:Na+-transporting NADH:ubiquinone oxidoreductase subunit A